VKNIRSCGKPIADPKAAVSDQVAQMSQPPGAPIRPPMQLPGAKPDPISLTGFDVLRT
jgi:hypothetical protein